MSICTASPPTTSAWNSRFSGFYREEQNAVRHSLTYSSTWDLPAAAEGILARAEEAVSCPVTTQVTRWRGIPRTEFTTTLDNRARDHRVRVVFENQAGAFHPQPYSIAEGQFDVLRRPLIHPLEGEGASPFHPQQNWVALMGKDGASDQLRTVTVINQGLPEYEIYPNAIRPQHCGDLTAQRQLPLPARRRPSDRDA